MANETRRTRARAWGTWQPFWVRSQASSEPGAQLALDYIVYRAAKEIGALTAALRGLDGLVFTAGIGEHSAEIRRRICEASAWLGVKLDGQANAAHGPRISATVSRLSP